VGVEPADYGANVGKDSQHTALAAFNLFFVSIYAPFAISATLSKIPDHPSGPYIAVMALVAMAVGTLLSGSLTGTALLLAPAIGMTALIQQAVDAHNISYQQTLFASFGAGVVSLIFTLVRPGAYGGRSLRFMILANIPEEVKAGIRGGVGALLATQAVENFSELTRADAAYHFPGLLVTICWATSFLILLCCSLILAAAERKKAELAPRRRLLLVSASALVCIALALVGWFAGRWPGVQPESGTLWQFLMAGWNPEADFSAPQLVTLGVLFLFIFFTDIPGTPYEKICMRNPDLAFRAKEAQEVHRSFIADAVMAMLSPVLRVPPSIYYSENAVLDEMPDGQLHNRNAAYLCAALQLLVAGAIWGFHFNVDAFRYISLFAVSPLLLYIGVRIVADSMNDDAARTDRQVVNSSSWRFVPAAVAIILTGVPSIGFAMAIPISIVTCAICWPILHQQEEYTDDRTKQDALTATLIFAVVSALIVIFWLAFTRVERISASPPAHRPDHTSAPSR
jgi:xanthine/uracil/vitamin C permease (AzgA family)